jgi:hypothetical protein
MGEFNAIMARDGHEFLAWLSAPSGPRRGAVVIIQEIFGVNEHIRAVTDSYAAEGYLAIAPSLFDRIRKRIELGYSPMERQEGMGYVKQLEPEQTMKGRCGRDRGREARRAGRHGWFLLGRPHDLPECVRAAARLWCRLLRRRHHADSGQEAEVSRDVSLRRA